MLPSQIHFQILPEKELLRRDNAKNLLSHQ